MNIAFQSVRTLVYAQARGERIIALLGERVVGSYGPVYNLVQAYVVGWERAHTDVEEATWEKHCLALERICALSIRKEWFSRVAVRFPSSLSHYHNILESCCISAKWSERLQAYLISESDTPYLDFLGVIP